jgi:hypothetical protein
MSSQHRWKRRSVRAVISRRYLMITAVVLAAATAVALAPRGLSNAAGIAAAGPAPAASSAPAAAPNDGGVTWTPDGTPDEGNDGNGGCQVAMGGTVSGPDAGVISQVAAALDDEGPVSVGQDGIGNLTVSAPAGESGATSMAVYADVAVDCSLVNQTDAYLRARGYGGVGQFARAVLDADLRPAGARGARALAVPAAYALPKWLRGALGAVAGALVFAAVSTIATATVVALAAGATVTSIALARIAAGVAGCLGGAAGVAAGLSIAGAFSDPLAKVAASAAGCAAGALAAQLPGAQALGGWLGLMLSQYLGTVPAVVGVVVEADAAAAAVELAPVETAVQDEVGALGHS